MAKGFIIHDAMSPWEFPTLYRGLLAGLLSDEAFVEVNERTGRKVSVLRSPVCFTIDLSIGLRIPVPGLRKVYPKTAAAEQAWYVSGSRSVVWLRKFTKIWDKFVEEDGETVEAAYGYRWRRHFYGRDQLGDAVRALKHNRSDRRCYVSAWDPTLDGNGRPSRNVPCPVGFNLAVVDGELNSCLFLRSNDIFVGLPYDVMGHSLLMEMVAKELEVRTGRLTYTIGHAHMYDAHWDMARECLRTRDTESYKKGPDMPGWSLSMVEDNPDGYVAAVEVAAEGVEWPKYNPRPDVVV